MDALSFLSCLWYGNPRFAFLRLSIIGAVGMGAVTCRAVRIRTGDPSGSHIAGRAAAATGYDCRPIGRRTTDSGNAPAATESRYSAGAEFLFAAGSEFAAGVD